MLNTVAMIASKLWQWQVLHANINATDNRAEPSPTVYMCNQSATRYALLSLLLYTTSFSLSSQIITLLN